MFEGQPKGLYALALANTGERFGYYTMLAIFTLFLQAKFGFTAATTSTIFASFLAGVYFMPLIGGILADKFGYGKMVTTGIVIMFAGYVLLAIPMATNIGLYSMFGALAPVSYTHLITRYSGKDMIPLAIFHGILIDMSVPVFVSFFCNLT